MAAIAKPNSDISNPGSWTASGGSSLYLDIDEGVPGDSGVSYVDSPIDPLLNKFRVGLESLTDPLDHTNHVLRYEAKKTGSKICNLIPALFENTTLIKIWSADTLTTVNQQFDKTLSIAEAATITDYTALRLEWSASTVPGGSNTRARINAAQFEVPENSVQGQVSLSGTATLTAEGSRFFHGIVALSGVATLTAGAVATFAASVSMSATAALTAIGLIEFDPIATMAATATGTFVATVLLGGGVAMSAVATMTTSAVMIFGGQTSLVGRATLTATAAGVNVFLGSALLNCFATLSATAEVFFAARCILQGYAHMTANATVFFAASVSMKGLATMSAVAAGIYGAVANLTGTATLTAKAFVAPLLEQHGIFSTIGTATMSAKGTVV